MQVYYFSATGHTRALAQQLSEHLSSPLCELPCDAPPAADTVVVVFPIYCQQIPPPIRQFLSALEAPQVALIATYGRMGYGNVLWEAAQLVRGTVIAGAYIPTGHSYLSDSVPTDKTALQPLIDRLLQPRAVTIPRASRHPFAALFPALRSRLGVRLRKTDRCRDCGLCSRRCPMQAMTNGVPNRSCIRCLRCVTECPSSAITVSYHPFLRYYLRKPRVERVVLYV